MLQSSELILNFHAHKTLALLATNLKPIEFWKTCIIPSVLSEIVSCQILLDQIWASIDTV